MQHTQTILLIGAGHVHLYVAARAQELISVGARVILIDPGEFWYSGMATGMLGGEYEAAEDRIDPRALIEANGGEFIQDRVVSVDASARRVQLARGKELAYDYLSVNVGSHLAIDSLPGAAADPSVWLVKPISTLWKLRTHLEAQFRVRVVPRVVVVGGGPTGCEVAANLKSLGRRHGCDLPLTLVTRGKRLINEAPAGAARRLTRKLRALDLDIYTDTAIARREGKSLVAEDGSKFEADIVVLAIGLEANPLVYAMGLPTHPTSGLQVTAALHSIADTRVFAGGDCAAMDGFDLPKLGVFGVRQAAYIHANLLASIEQKPLREYKPQSRYLAILNLGDGTALSTWGPLWWLGRGSLLLKDYIDKRFLEGYRKHYQA